MGEGLGVVAFEVGRHLADVEFALPLRSVCKAWKENVSFNTPFAEVDLAPEDTSFCKQSSNVIFDLCPGVRSLTAHVSPGVCRQRFRTTMERLKTQLPHLEHLTLSFNNLSQELSTEDVLAISCLHGLRSLTVHGNVAPDCDLSGLRSVLGLTELVFVATELSTGLTDKHVKELSCLSSLARLDFPAHSRMFTGETLRDICASLRLERLRISTSKYAISPESFPPLKKMMTKTLFCLDVCVPDVSYALRLLDVDAAMSDVVLSIKEPATPSQIVALCSCKNAGFVTGLEVQVKGAPTADVLAALSKCSSLRKLSLSSKDITRMKDTLDLTVLAGLVNLTHLHLHINPAWRRALDESSVATLAGAWTRLTHFHLRVKAGDSLNRFSQFMSLESLNLQFLNSPPGTFVDLGSLPSRLACLELTSVMSVSLICSDGASVRTSLQSLTLDGNFCVDDALISRLVTRYPNLKKLSLVLMGRQKMTHAGLAEIGRMRQLEQLVLQDFREGPLSLSQMSLSKLNGLSRLKSFKLTLPELSRDRFQPSCFEQFTALRRLHLPTTSCQAAAAVALSGVLKRCAMKYDSSWVESPVK